jgi:spore coat protein U-like protein
MKKWILMAIAIAAFTVPLRAGNCSWITTPTNIALGGYSVFGSASLVTTSSYAFRCTPNTNATLTFSTGANASNYFPRYLRNGANTIAYNVFDDAATSIVIGNGSGGTTSRVVFNSTPADKDFADTVYGKVIEGADVPAGTYTDTITASLSWGNGSISAVLTVTAVVIPECTISATNLAFGNYDPVVTNAVAPLDSSSEISVYCTRNTQGTIALGNGLWFSGGRRLRNPAPDFLTYSLFRDAGRTAQWLSAAPNVVTQTSTSKLTPMAMTVYGRIPANQDPRLGAYTDTVQAVVNY